MKRIGLTIMSALAMLSVASVGSASAATEVGNNCVSVAAIPDFTVLQLSKAGSPPNTVPSAGVVTKWRVSLFDPEPVTVPTRMRVFREADGANRFTTVAESEIGNVSPGTNEFDTRIPVQAGDRFGAFGTSETGTPICISADEADKMGIYVGDAGVGQTQTYEEAAGLLSPVLATVEPDIDGDGYGDETQDLCPASAAVHAVACPIVTLGSYGIARRNAATILATSSYPIPVAISATVNVPRQLLGNKRGKRKGKRGARSSALVRIDGGVQTIAPGGLVPYALKFPRALRKALKNLPRKRKLTLIATTSATDVAGRPSSTTVKVKLPGQKKPNPGKRKAKGKRG